MTKIDEVSARVDAALVTLTAGGLYDFRPTHYNHEATRRLQNVIQLFASGVVDEAAMKAAIRELCDTSRVSYIDFHIKVPEPGYKDFRRLALLFGREHGVRLIPPRDADERAANYASKVQAVVGLVIACRQPISEKLKQQFTALVVGTKDKSAELLGMIYEYEHYNEYKKKLTPTPPVQLNYDVAPQSADVGADTAFTPETLDNESFEQRLPPAKPARVKPRGFEEIWPVAETVELKPGEGLPLHEEFRDFCEQLYETRTS
jgi:hypothetical protein